MNGIIKFNYDELDIATKEFLLKKETNIKNIMQKAYTEIGKELKEAQEKLSNNRNGMFEEWYKSVGFTKTQVNRIINRYNFIVSNWDNKEVIEKLPISLSYEVSRPSTSEELQQKVLSGEIKTLKEFNEQNKKVNELDVITHEIRLKMNDIENYRNYICQSFERIKKSENLMKEKDCLLSMMGLDCLDFAEELRPPTDEEFYDYLFNEFIPARITERTY